MVRDFLDGADECMAHAVNLCEVFYDFMRDQDEDEAASAVEDLKGRGLVVREDIDQEFWQEVGRHKATNRVSLADCFAIALANRVNGELITSDHHEFDPIADQGICRVQFIR